MEDTSGFYKLQEEELLLFAPNGVMNQSYDLLRENHLNYQYPIDGWYWFDSEEESRLFFNLPEKEIEIEENNNDYL